MTSAPKHSSGYFCAVHRPASGLPPQPKGPDSACQECGEPAPLAERTLVTLKLLLAAVVHLGNAAPEVAPQPAVVPDDEAVTFDQALWMLGCKKTRLYELLAEGKVTRLQRVGRKVMIDRASVEACRRGGAAQQAPEPRRRAPQRPASSGPAPAFGARVRALKP